MNKPAALYIEYLANPVRRELSFILDPVEQRLIESFAQEWHKQSRLTVMTAMHNVPGMSPSTVHRRLKTLYAKGMIMLVPDTTNTRIKYVQPGVELVKDFSRIGQIMATIVDAGS